MNRRDIIISFVLISFMISSVTAQEISDGQLQQTQKQGLADKVINVLSGSMKSIVSEDRGSFVAGDDVQLKAQSICIKDYAGHYGDRIYNPGIWLQVEDPNGEIVYNKMIHEWDSYGTYAKKGDCYSYDANWDIPNDIGSDSGRYTFKMWEVKDLSDDIDDNVILNCDDTELPECTKKISNMEYGEFEIENGQDYTNDAPEVSLDTPNDLLVGQTGIFYADITDDGFPVNIRWYVDGEQVGSDGFDNPDDPIDTSPRFTHEFNDAGEHKIRALVTDNGAKVGSETSYINVENDANERPNADIDATDTTIETGETVTLDAYDSSDPDGDISEYEWSNGRHGETVSLSFEETGSKDITLTVTDNEGATDTDSIEINVESSGEPPEARINGPSEGKTGEQLIFEGGGSTDDASITEYNWDVNGETTSSSSYSTVFDSSGEYTVELEVVDEDGFRDTATKTVSITQSNKEPVINGISYPEDINVGQDFTVTAEASDPNGDTLSYEWESGKTGKSISVSFDEPGRHNLNLVVSDGEIQTSKTVAVKISASDDDNDGHYNYDDDCPNTPIEYVSKVGQDGCYENKQPSPKFIATSDSVEIGESVSFDASRASDPEGRLVSYEWSVDGKSKTGELVSFSFDEEGSKTVELTVKDAAGNEASATRTIEVGDENSDNNGESNNDNNEESFDLVKWLEDVFEVFDI